MQVFVFIFILIGTIYVHAPPGSAIKVTPDTRRQFNEARDLAALTYWGFCSKIIKSQKIANNETLEGAMRRIVAPIKAFMGNNGFSPNTNNPNGLTAEEVESLGKYRTAIVSLYLKFEKELKLNQGGFSDDTKESLKAWVLMTQAEEKKAKERKRLEDKKKKEQKRLADEIEEEKLRSEEARERHERQKDENRRRQFLAEEQQRQHSLKNQAPPRLVGNSPRVTYHTMRETEIDYKPGQKAYQDSQRRLKAEAAAAREQQEKAAEARLQKQEREQDAEAERQQKAAEAERRKKERKQAAGASARPKSHTPRSDSNGVEGKRHTSGKSLPNQSAEDSVDHGSSSSHLRRRDHSTSPLRHQNYPSSHSGTKDTDNPTQALSQQRALSQQEADSLRDALRNRGGSPKSDAGFSLDSAPRGLGRSTPSVSSTNQSGSQNGGASSYFMSFKPTADLW
eukprot:Platyproteum_vivax@DN16368_c0_g1_i1.p1